MYKLYFTSQAQADAKKMSRSYLKVKCERILDALAEDPFDDPISYKKLNGELKGCYSRRINVQHRLVYEVDEKKKTIKILSMWSHYDSV